MIRCFTPSVTAFGGDSSLKEGALENGRAFFDKLTFPLEGGRLLGACFHRVIF